MMLKSKSYLFVKAVCYHDTPLYLCIKLFNIARIMKPIKFKEATKVLQKPSTMTNAECASLHVWTDGKECVSCWKPSAKDRLHILFHGNIYLGILSGCSTQPPVFVTAEYPFCRPSLVARVRSFLTSVRNYFVRHGKAD